MNGLLALFCCIIAAFLIAALLVRVAGGNCLLVDDWKKAWRYYTTWALAFLALLPDLWNSLIYAGFGYGDDVPQAFSYALKGGVVFALLVRQVSQVQRPTKPDWDGDGKPG